MKVESSKPRLVYQPVTLTLTFDSLMEEDLFYKMISSNSSIPEVLSHRRLITFNQVEPLTAMMEQIFVSRV